MASLGLIFSIYNLRFKDSKSLQKYFKRLEYIPSVRNKKVMDFGCGQGLVSLNLLDRGASEVLGVDNDEMILSFAREKLPKSVKGNKINPAKSHL